jgi:hypothetical protein
VKGDEGNDADGHNEIDGFLAPIDLVFDFYAFFDAFNVCVEM